MSRLPSLGIPPLAGLANYEGAQKVGPSVDENVDLLRRYNYIKSRLYEISASFMNPTPEWEVKCALSLHLYLDGEHSQSMRARVAELRRPPLYLDESPDDRLQLLMDEAISSQNTIELLSSVYGVIRPALIEAFEAHLSRLNPIVDHPTARIFRQMIQEETQMTEWGAAALAALTADEQDAATAKSWATHISMYLAAAGGVAGTDPKPDNVSLPTARFTGSFVPDVDPKRDWRSGDIYNFAYRADEVYNDSTADYDERNLALMYKRFHEMDVPEMMASIVVQTKGKDWEYYRDMGRQLWDEARHAMMGEIWFAKYDIDWSRYPNHVAFSLYLNLDRTPLERHIVLYNIEQSLMNGKWGKRQEWLIAQNANDPLATYFQDYDWADEVLHAQIGRKWLKPEIGTVKAILDRAAEINAKPRENLEARRKSTAQIDWWPTYVSDILGKPSTSKNSEPNLDQAPLSG
jgi:hypothetical protein